MPRVALFDMDKTLIRENSARLFTRFRRDRGEVGWEASARVSFWLLLYWFGRLDAHTMASKVLAEYCGARESDMIELCDLWFRDYVKPHISDLGRRAVEAHRRRGDRLVIASSATQFATRPLLRELKMDELICTEVAIEDGNLTGEVIAPLCYGPGKLERAKKYLESIGSRLEEATFYSDSITDLPLLAAVGEPVVVNPDLRLRIEAKKRGWPIKRW